MTVAAAALAGLVIGAAVVSQRGGTSLLPGPARRQARAEALLHVVLPSVRFRGAPLDRALEELSKRTGATLVIDWDALEAGGVSREEPIDVSLSHVTLERALKEVLGYAGAGGDRETPQYTLFDGAVVVTSGDAMGAYVYAAAYDLRGIETPVFEPAPAMFQGAAPATTSNLCFFSLQQSREVPPQVEADDELTRLLQETVAPDEWYDAGGTGGTVHAFGGRVVAVTTWQNHRQIQSLVEQLRNPCR